MNIFNLIAINIIYIFILYFNNSILQDQYYSNKRYILFKKDKIKNNLFLYSLYIPLLIIATILPLYFEFTSFLALLLPLFSLIITTKRKLIITRRSIILLLVSIIILFSLNITYYLLLPYFYIFIESTIISYLIVVLISNLFDLPIEKLIQRHYYLITKKKLASSRDLKIIGITGSYGKTTVKYFLKQTLGDINPLSTDKNINTPMGLCRFINENLSVFDHYLIIELGVDEVRGMKKFKKFLKLDYAIITSVGMQHIRTFKTLDNIKKEKQSIQDLLKPGGILFYNADTLEILEKKKEIQYVPIKESDYSVLDSNTIKTNETKIKLPLLTRHLIFDAYLSYIVSLNFISKERLCAIMPNITLPERRKRIYQKESLIVIDDSYNINLESVKDDIELMKQFKKPYQIVSSGLAEINNNKDMLKTFFEQLNQADSIIYTRKLSKSEKEIIYSLKIKDKIKFKKRYIKEGTLLILTFGTSTTLR